MTRLDDLYKLRAAIDERDVGPFDAKLFRLRRAVNRHIDCELQRQARIAELAANIEVPANEEPDSDAPSFGGRPHMPDTHTVEEMMACHAAKERGLRDEWTMAGERQYQRHRSRAKRACA